MPDHVVRPDRLVPPLDQRLVIAATEAKGRVRAPTRRHGRNACPLVKKIAMLPLRLLRRSNIGQGEVVPLAFFHEKIPNRARAGAARGEISP